MLVRLLTALLVVLSAALIAAVAIWVLRDDDDYSPPAVGEPTALTASELSEFAAEQSTPVYWLGERGADSYEVTDSRSGRIYVRYLTDGAGAGEERADFLTVATYPSQGGVAALRKAVREEKGAQLGKTDDDAVLLVDPASIRNAHLASPGANLQIEVYSPVAGEALRLAARGEVEPVP